MRGVLVKLGARVVVPVPLPPGGVSGGECDFQCKNPRVSVDVSQRTLREALSETGIDGALEEVGEPPTLHELASDRLSPQN